MHKVERFWRNILQHTVHALNYYANLIDRVGGVVPFFLCVWQKVTVAQPGFCLAAGICDVTYFIFNYHKLNKLGSDSRRLFKFDWVGRLCLCLLGLNNELINLNHPCSFIIIIRVPPSICFI